MYAVSGWSTRERRRRRRSFGLSFLYPVAVRNIYCRAALPQLLLRHVELARKLADCRCATRRSRESNPGPSLSYLLPRDFIEIRRRVKPGFTEKAQPTLNRSSNVALNTSLRFWSIAQTRVLRVRNVSKCSTEAALLVVRVIV